MNIAVAMAAKAGMRVGLLDADVHGPSVPRMMHLSGRPCIVRLADDLRPGGNAGLLVASPGLVVHHLSHQWQRRCVLAWIAQATAGGGVRTRL